MADELDGSGDLPHPPKMTRKRYERELLALQIELVFDRSWDNRAGVERVRGFCTPQESVLFLRQAPDFERGWSTTASGCSSCGWR